MAKLTILAKMERNGQKSQNGHAKNHSALSALFALLTVKVQKMQIVQCKKLHENCENSEKSHFSQCKFFKLDGIRRNGHRKNDIALFALSALLRMKVQKVQKVQSKFLERK